MTLAENQIVAFLPTGSFLSGGGCSDSLLNIDNVMNNLYPDLPEDKAVEGTTAECRCIFIKNLSEVDSGVKLIPWISSQSSAQCQVQFGIGAGGINAHEVQLPTPYMAPPNVEFFNLTTKPTEPMIVKLGPKQTIAIWFNWRTNQHSSSEANVRFTFSLEVEREPEPDPGPGIQCPTGQVLDPTTGLCVTPTNCPQGQTYNPITRRCEEDDPDTPSPCGICADNWHCNPVTGECEPDVVNPPPTGTIPLFKFGAVGDFDCSNATDDTFNSLINNLVTTQPHPQGLELSLLLALGDFSYNDGDQSCWIDLCENNLDQMFPTNIKCIIGNHDDEEDGERVDREVIINTFGMPSEGYYAFTKHNMRFIMMDTQRPHGVNSPQYNFVNQQLQQAHADPGIKWKIVCYHKPSVTSTGNDHGALLSMATAYHALFTQYQVDFVLSGHNHNSEVTYQLKFTAGNTDPTDAVIGSQGSTVGTKTVYQGWNGTIYMVLGGGGRAEDSTDADDPYMAAAYEPIAVGYFDLTSNGRTMQFRLSPSPFGDDVVYELEVRK